MKAKVAIINYEEYNKIIDNIDKDGKDYVHFLVDFDKTLTKAYIKGKSFPSLISILRNDVSILGYSYAKKAHALYDYYSKIENDPGVAKQDKVVVMSEWWRKHQALLVESGLTKRHIKDAVDSGYLKFRDGIKEFVNSLAEKQIPLIIISANGIGGDSIRMFFEKHNLMSDNVSIISNVLKFDEKGVTCGFENKVIHSFNKTEAVIKDYPEVYSKVKDRKNVILMGDSLGDPDMVDGFAYKNLLKIGFFNESPESILESNIKLYKQFRDSYDVVIHNDGDLNFVNKLVKKIK